MKNKFLRVVSFMVSILVLAALVSACGAKNNANGAGGGQSPQAAPGSEPAASGGAGALKIGFSFGQSVHPFFIAMEKGARDAAQKAGVELYVTSADYKLENQLANVEDLLQKGVKAILLNPIDSKAFTNVVNQAIQKNIGVFTVDIGVVGAKATSHIASDNKEIGRMAARYINEKLNGKGKVAYIGDQSITSLLDREEGFKEELAKYPGLELVASQGGAIERAKAMEAAENILQAHPDVDAFFGTNESSAMGELSALKAHNNTKAFVVGVDATPDLLNAIKDGTQVTATISQDPYKMGQMAVENAVKFANGESVEAYIPVVTDLVTKDNVDQYIEREAQYQK